MGRTEHLGFASTHPDEWWAGATCVQCQDWLDTKRAANVSPDLSASVFGTVPGGASPLVPKQAWERKFNTDMHEYREARRAGERPEQISRKAIRENRQRHEVLERAIDQDKVAVID